VEDKLRSVGIERIHSTSNNPEQRKQYLSNKLAVVPGIIGRCSKCHLHLGLTSALDTILHDVDDEDSKTQIADSFSLGCSALVPTFRRNRQQDVDEALQAIIQVFPWLEELLEYRKTTLLECDRCGWSR
jgi:hypothetical protein